MDLTMYVDIDAVMRDVVLLLEMPQLHRGTGRRSADGRVRGHPVTVAVWHRTGNSAPTGGEIKAEIGALPLVLRVRRAVTGDDGLIEQGVITAVRAGDPAFDAEWVMEG